MTAPSCPLLQYGTPRDVPFYCPECVEAAVREGRPGARQLPSVADLPEPAPNSCAEAVQHFVRETLDQRLAQRLNELRGHARAEAEAEQAFYRERPVFVRQLSTHTEVERAVEGSEMQPLEAVLDAAGCVTSRLLRHRTLALFQRQGICDVLLCVLIVKARPRVRPRLLPCRHRGSCAIRGCR